MVQDVKNNNPDFTFEYLYGITDCKELWNNNSYYSIFPDTFSGLMEINQSKLDKKGFSLVYGNLPEDKSEAAISLLTYYCFRYCGYYDINDGYRYSMSTVDEYDDIVGKQLNFDGNISFTVTGIIDTCLNLEDYGITLEDYSSNYFFSDSYTSEYYYLQDYFIYSYHSALFAGEAGKNTYYSDSFYVSQSEYNENNVNKNQYNLYGYYPENTLCRGAGFSYLSDLNVEVSGGIYDDYSQKTSIDVILSRTELYNYIHNIYSYRSVKYNDTNALIDIINSQIGINLNMGGYTSYDQGLFNTFRIVGFFEDEEEALPQYIFSDTRVAQHIEGIDKYSVLITNFVNVESDILLNTVTKAMNIDSKIIVH
jgi:hypothetical protein